MADHQPTKSTAEPTVWLVILHWHGFALTTDCLQSIQKLTYTNFKTLIVDNGSLESDGLALKKAFPEIEVLRLNENFGFAGGCNKGINEAMHKGADYIWLLNNDTKVAPASLSTLVKEAKAAPQAGALGALIVDSLSNEDKRMVAGHGAIDFIHAKTKVSGDKPGIPVNCDWLHGSNLFLRAETIAQIGPFDERYFLYFEDTELCHRMRLAGWQCLFVPAAEIEHIGNASTQDKRRFWRSYYYIRNRFLFFETYLSGIKRLPALFFMLTHIARHLLVLPFRGENGRCQLRAELLGTRDYLARRFGKATCLDWCEPQKSD